MSIVDQIVVKHVGGLMGYEVMIPSMYLAGVGLGPTGIDLGSDESRMTYLLNSIQYFRLLSLALGQLYNEAYVGLPKIKGNSTRVGELLDDIRRRGGIDGVDVEAERMKEQAQASEKWSGVAPVVEDEANLVQFEHVDVFSPDGDCLIQDLSLKIGPREHLIIEGANGSGKSSLLRTLGGLWPLSGGRMKTTSAIVYLPQRPYLCSGSLRDQLLYPAAVDDNGGDAELAAVDAKLDALMESVGLGSLVEREGGWDAGSLGDKDWGEILSGGERQRVAVARLLLAAPKYAVLDEATAAVSKEIEEELLRLIDAAGVTMISVSHRPTLRRFHMQVLRILKDGEGGWETEDIRSECVL